MNDEFSTNPVGERLIEEVRIALAGKQYGSVEIYIEAGRVVQITERVIKKTNKIGENTTARKPNYIYSRTSPRSKKKHF